MSVWSFQSNFNQGELDPLLLGRIDIQAYYNAVALARNVLSIPQGGLKKRPGTVFINEALGEGRIEKFAFNIEQQYLLVFTDLKMEIYKDGVLQTNIAGSGNDYLDTPWSGDEIRDFDYLQSADTIIITHEDYAPRTIYRTSDTNWYINLITFLGEIPQYDFNDGSSPAPTDAIQNVVFTNFEPGMRYKLSLEGVLTEEIIVNPALAGNEAPIANALLDLPNTPNTGITCTFTSYLAGVLTMTVTFTGDAANNWDLIGATLIYSAGGNNVSTATVQVGVSSAEDTWSATRGYPRTCTFHEGRLWFGGSKSRPSTIWGSRVGDFFNFDKGRSLDDQAIEVTLDTDQVNAVNAIYSNRSLQIFTSGGEFFVKESPITPTNIAVSPQSSLGSRRVRPATIDGVTLFAQRTGKAIIQFLYLDQYQANEARSISVTAAHLINTPLELVAQAGSLTIDANYVYVVNSDGNVSVYNTLSAENVSGFTRWETNNGNIISAAVVDDELYLLVERDIDGSTVYYIEKEELGTQTDSAIVGGPTVSQVISGLDHLEGEDVWAKLDGAFAGTYTVSSGEITVDRDATEYEVGIAFVPEIQTMPLNIQLQNGPNASAKKKIQRVSLQLYESNGVIVNEKRLPDKTIGVNQFDPPDPFTGLKRLHLLGWNLTADVIVTQDTPMPLTLLNLGLEVAT